MRSILSIIIFTALVLGTASAQEAPQLRAKLDKWIDANRIIAQEKAEWTSEKQILERMIELLEAESQRLDEQIEAARADQSTAQRKRQEITERRESLSRTSEQVSAQIGSYETETLALAKRLPPPLLKELEPLLQNIPSDPGNTRRSIGQRTQNVLSILDAVEKFNADLTLDTNIQTLENGTAVEVETLYLGLGQAFYIDTSGTHAGMLTLQGDAWVATEQPDLAPVIKRAIAIYKNTEKASFVELPLQTQHSE